MPPCDRSRVSLPFMTGSVSRRIRAGTVWVNTFMDGYPELPFGGYKESGQGRELGRFAIEEFTELKTIQLHLGPRRSWWAAKQHRGK